MGKKADKSIKTYPELKKFVLAILDAHGNMISTSEGAEAIEKAFNEFEQNFRDEFQKAINQLSESF